MLPNAWSPFSLPPLMTVWVSALLKGYVAYMVTHNIILTHLANAHDFPQLDITVATSVGRWCFVRCVCNNHTVYICCCCCMPLRRCPAAIGGLAATSSCTGQLVGRTPRTRHYYFLPGTGTPYVEWMSVWMCESCYFWVCVSSFWILFM